MSGIDMADKKITKGIGKSHRGISDQIQFINSREDQDRGGPDRDGGRNAAGGRREPAGDRRHPASGRRQAWHRGAPGRPSQDGDPIGHDHRGQSTHRGFDRGRGGRGRFPGPGEAGNEARGHQKVPAGRPHGGDDRRRDERRPRPGAGGRRRGHERRAPRRRARPRT